MRNEPRVLCRYASDHMSFALDGEVFQQLTTSSRTHHGDRVEFFDTPYYMILNTAVGGPWPGPVSPTTKFPTYHHVDYVRVAQPATARD